MTATPHDALFKAALSKPRHARGLLRALLARQVGRRKAEEMLTTAEKLRREGHREGEAQGRTEGKREALLLLVRQRFGRLPAATLARVDQADAAQLDAWFGQVLTASSLDDLFGAQVAVPPGKATPPARTQPRSARKRTRR